MCISQGSPFTTRVSIGTRCLLIVLVHKNIFFTQVEIALREARAGFVKHEVDYSNGDKPEWYAEKINPLGKVRV